MAYVIPITDLSAKRGDRGPVVLVIVLTGENLERMREGDPFDMQLRNYLPESSRGRRMDELDLVIAYEADATVLLEHQKTGNLRAIMEWLERGRRHRPGDLGPPIRLPRKQESN